MKINNSINWEQRRYEIAKEALQLGYNFEVILNDHLDSKLIAKRAVDIADALIVELKKAHEEPINTRPVEAKIGSTINIDGVDYVCLNAGDEDCSTCDLLIDGDCAGPSWIRCHTLERKDGKNVKFIKKEV